MFTAHLPLSPRTRGSHLPCNPFPTPSKALILNTLTRVQIRSVFAAIIVMAFQKYLLPVLAVATAVGGKFLLYHAHAPEIESPTRLHQTVFT